MRFKLSLTDFCPQFKTVNNHIHSKELLYIFSSLTVSIIHICLFFPDDINIGSVIKGKEDSKNKKETDEMDVKYTTEFFEGMKLESKLNSAVWSKSQENLSPPAYQNLADQRRHTSDGVPPFSNLFADSNPTEDPFSDPISSPFSDYNSTPRPRSPLKPNITSEDILDRQIKGIVY